MMGSLRKSLRLTFRLAVTYIRMNWRLFSLGIIAGFILIFLSPKIFNYLYPQKFPIIGIVGNYTASTLPLSIQRQISFGLTKLTADDQASPAAAVSVVATQSGKETVTFALDQNLFWHDGTKFESSQINYNLRGVTFNRKSLYEIEMQLTEPFAPLLTVVSQPLFKNGLVGLGDYQVQSLKYNGRFLGEIDLINKGQEKRLTYKFYPTQNMAVSALKLGLVNTLTNLSQTYQLERDPHYQTTSTISYDQVVAVFFNLRKDPQSDKQFRQALTYALPNNFPPGEAAYSPISKTNWAYSSTVKKYPQNLDLARKYLDKYASASAKPKLSLVTTRELEPTAKLVADSWSAVGVAADVTATDILPLSFDAYLTTISLPPDPDQYFLWHSTQQGNISGYKSPKVDRLLEDGRKNLEIEARKEIYANFQRAITEDVPAIFLYYPVDYTIERQ